MLIFIIGCSSVVQAQTNFHAMVTNCWYQGEISNVLVLANTRLAANSNDIAGLILKMECKIAFLDLPEVSNSIWSVIQAGDTITTSNFVKRFQREREELLDDLELFKTYPTSEQLPIERAKAFIKNKEFPTYLLDALQIDGFFNQ